ncbi:MAG: type II secretion system protein [Fimbriimonas sp.]|nr:type II secretion system protein [Fimbriimonas sp.]
MRRQRGNSLAEILVAAAFLGVCSAALTDTAQQAVANIARTERRAVALAALQNRLEVATQNAQSSTSLPSVVTYNADLPGRRICVIKISPAWSAYTGVAQIVGTATWPESKGSRNYSETITIETYVRCPDVD